MLFLLVCFIMSPHFLRITTEGCKSGFLESTTPVNPVKSFLFYYLYCVVTIYSSSFFNCSYIMLVKQQGEKLYPELKQCGEIHSITHFLFEYNSQF